MDGLIWLRTGSRVASRVSVSQSTVSRNARRCADVFAVDLVRRGGEWYLKGNLALLNLERQVHQLVRWLDDQPLRLEAQHWSAPLVSPSPVDGWIAGNLDFFEYHRPLQLLRDHVIDAWITSYPDVPADDPNLVSIHLSRMPMMLVVKDGHPLLDLGDRVSFEAIARYPILPLPDGAFPGFQQVLIDCGLWQPAAKDGPAEPPAWRGQSGVEDLLVGFATPLTLPLYGESFRQLPLRLPVEVGDALVVARAFIDYPQTHQLAAFLRTRLRSLAATTPELVILEPADRGQAVSPAAPSRAPAVSP